MISEMDYNEIIKHYMMIFPIYPEAFSIKQVYFNVYKFFERKNNLIDR